MDKCSWLSDGFPRLGWLLVLTASRHDRIGVGKGIRSPSKDDQTRVGLRTYGVFGCVMARSDFHYDRKGWWQPEKQRIRPRVITPSARQLHRPRPFWCWNRGQKGQQGYFHLLVTCRSLCLKNPHWVQRFLSCYYGAIKQNQIYPKSRWSREEFPARQQPCVPIFSRRTRIFSSIYRFY